MKKNKLQRVGSSEGRRVSWLQEQLSHSEPYYFLQVTGEESPSINSGILRAKNDCHPQNDVTTNETQTCSNSQSEIKHTPSTTGRGNEFQHEDGVLEIQGKGAYYNQRLLSLSKLVKILPTNFLTPIKNLVPYYPSALVPSKKAAFTLAEVLITLGIIGVVAAMTMPTLIQKQQKIEASSRLKKFYSSMSQAIMLSELENGEASGWSKTGIINSEDGNYDMEANSNYSDAFFRKYLAPYLKYVSAEKDADFAYYTKVAFADGSVMHVRNGGCYDIYFDVNGDRKPNKQGRDKFVFILCPNTPNNFFMPNAHFKAYGANTNDRSTLINSCKQYETCAAILQYDNWEFKEDYPYN